MAFYEAVFIIRPDIATTQVDLVTEKVSELITKAGGKVIKTEQWGLRTLAYRIKKHKKGYYIMLGVDMPGTVVAEMEHHMKLSDDIIRYHTIAVEAMTDEPSVMMKFKAKAAEYESRDKEDTPYKRTSRPHA